MKKLRNEGLTFFNKDMQEGRPKSILGCDETDDVKEIDLHWRKSSNPSLFDDCGKKKEEARRSST